MRVKVTGSVVGVAVAGIAAVLEAGQVVDSVAAYFSAEDVHSVNDVFARIFRMSDLEFVGFVVYVGFVLAAVSVIVFGVAVLFARIAVSAKQTHRQHGGSWIRARVPGSDATFQVDLEDSASVIRTLRDVARAGRS
ncbi:MAG TPA: hypothetical protein VME47_10705 [Acetobacteraceae bacterium]|nr:hypothetical protein [Acetobacteraceae bacterium]